MQKPTPQKIRALIDDIVFNRIKDGQLDECGLSVSELRILRESFAKTLRSMLHSRIDYPKPVGKEEKAPSAEGPGSEPGGESKEAEAAKEAGSGKQAGNVVPVEELEKHRRKASGQS